MCERCTAASSPDEANREREESQRGFCVRGVVSAAAATPGARDPEGHAFALHRTRVLVKDLVIVVNRTASCRQGQGRYVPTDSKVHVRDAPQVLCAEEPRARLGKVGYLGVACDNAWGPHRNGGQTHGQNVQVTAIAHVLFALRNNKGSALGRRVTRSGVSLGRQPCRVALTQSSASFIILLRLLRFLLLLLLNATPPPLLHTKASRRIGHTLCDTSRCPEARECPSASAEAWSRSSGAGLLSR